MWFLLFPLVLIGSAVEGKEYTVIVSTASEFGAGTDADVKIRVHGTRGNIQPREIRGQFEQGSKDTIQIEDYDIGFVTGMEIYRNDHGFLPSWKLNKVVIRIFGAPDSIFNYYGWVPANKWISLPLSCPSGFRLTPDGHYCTAMA